MPNHNKDFDPVYRTCVLCSKTVPEANYDPEYQCCDDCANKARAEEHKDEISGPGKAFDKDEGDDVI